MAGLQAVLGPSTSWICSEAVRRGEKKWREARLLGVRRLRGAEGECKGSLERLSSQREQPLIELAVSHVELALITQQAASAGNRDLVFRSLRSEHASSRRHLRYSRTSQCLCCQSHLHPLRPKRLQRTGNRDSAGCDRGDPRISEGHQCDHPERDQLTNQSATGTL